MNQRILHFLALVLITTTSLLGQGISSVTVSPSPICVGNDLTVTFSDTGTYLAANKFSVILSDATGGFTAGTTTLTADAASPTVITLPATLGSSALYKVKVASSHPFTEKISSAFTVTAIPAVPTVATIAPFCAGETVTSANITAAISGITGTLKWYTAATGGTATSAPATAGLTSTAGVKTLYVSQATGECESDRVAVEITVTAGQTAPVVTNPEAVCAGSDVTVATITAAVPAGTYNWYATATSTAPITLTAYTSIASTVELYVAKAATATLCESPRSKVTITVNSIPTAPTVTTIAALCVGETITAADITSKISGVTGTLKWYTAATGGTATTAPSVTGLTTAAGTTTLYVSQANGDCESARVPVAITTLAPQTAPVVTNPSAVCSGTNVTVATITASVPTGTTYNWYSSQTSATPITLANYNNIAATVELWVSKRATATLCEGPRSKVTIAVTPTPARPTVANLGTVCSNDTLTTAMIIGQVSGVTGTLQWYTAATGGTATTSPVIPTGTGVRTFYVSQKAGDCESPRAPFTVTLATQPATPTVTNFDDVCLNTAITSAQLRARVTSSVTGQLVWYTTATGGTGSTTIPTVSTTSAGTKDFYVAHLVNGCESSRAKISLVVNPAVAAPTVTSSITACFGSTPAPVLTATGTALKWYTSATGGTGATIAPVVSTTTAGTKKYYVSQTINSCEGPRAEITVIVTQTTKPVVADTSFCIGIANAKLTATGTALKWYTSATGGTGSTTVPTIATTAAGTSIHYVTQTLNGCESDRAAISVTVKANPVAPIVKDLADVCLNTSVTSVQLLNSVQTATGILKWYTAATGGTGQATAFTPSTATAGTKSYYVTQTVNGCESPRAEIDLETKALPKAPVIENEDFCQNVTATALTATADSSNTLKWYTVASGGTALTAAPTPTTTTVTTLNYYVSQTAKHSATLACEGPRANIKAIINPLPVAASVLDQEICQTRLNENQAFKATATTGNSLVWFTAATGGVASDSVPTVNLKNDGSFRYFVSQETAKGCVGPRKEVKIVVNPLPAAPTSTDLEFCQFDVAKPLVATFATSAVQNWYGQSATGGTASRTAPTPSTKDGGNFSYYVSQSVKTCESDRKEIKVLVKSTPKPATQTALAYCHQAVAPVLTATGQNLKWYRDNGQMSTTAFTPFTESVGDQFFYVTQTGSNGCESAKEEIKITINPKPSSSIAGTTSINLGSTANLTINFTGGGPWNYKLSNGQIGVANSTPHTIPVTPTTTTTYFVTEVSNSCGVGTPNGSAVVTVRIPTITTGNPTILAICAKNNISVPVQLSGDFPSDNKFELQISKTNTSSSFYTIPSIFSNGSVIGTTPDTTSAGNYFIRVIGQNSTDPVLGSVSGVQVNIRALPTATLSADQKILIGQTAQIPVNFTGNAPWTFAYSNGVSEVSITTSSNPHTFTVAPETTTTYTITHVANECGVGKSSGQTRIQVDPILGVEPKLKNWAKVLPTLVEDACIVEVEDISIRKNVTLQVMDLTGRTIQSIGIGAQHTPISLSNQPTGIYLFRLNSDKGSTLIKVLKK